MNPFDDKFIAEESFSYLDLLGQVKWTAWTVSYSFATATSLTVVGRYKVVGKLAYAQVKSTGTSLATTAGTSTITLPITAKGHGGSGTMQNITTNVAVGVGVISVADNKFYPPTQGASGNGFVFSFWWEI